MTDQQIDQISAGREMDALIAALMEPVPESISAKELRAKVGMKEWYSSNCVCSPGGWWRAEIGTDHNLDESGSFRAEKDNDPVKWEPARESSTDIADAWPLVEMFNIIVWPLGAGTYKTLKADIKTYDRSAPLAVCKTALKFVSKGQ